MEVSTNMSLKELERFYFTYLWKQNNFNNARTAKTLKISLKAFRARLIEFGFNRQKVGKHWVIPEKVYDMVDAVISTHAITE